MVTAKLHGGFCVSDSDRTDYKVTNTPRGWPRATLTLELPAVEPLVRMPVIELFLSR